MSATNGASSAGQNVSVDVKRLEQEAECPYSITPSTLCQVNSVSNDVLRMASRAASRANTPNRRLKYWDLLSMVSVLVTMILRQFNAWSNSWQVGLLEPCGLLLVEWRTHCGLAVMIIWLPWLYLCRTRILISL